MKPIAHSPLTRAKLGSIGVLVALMFSGALPAHAQETYIQLSTFDDLAESLSLRDQQRRAMIDEFAPDEADALGRLVLRLVTNLTLDLDAVFVGVEELTRLLRELEAQAQRAHAAADQRDREASVLFDAANREAARASALQDHLAERLRGGLDRNSVEALEALGELNRTRVRAAGAQRRAQRFQARAVALRQRSDLRDMILSVAQRREELLNLQGLLEEQAQDLLVTAELGAETIDFDAELRSAQAALNGFVASAAELERGLRVREQEIQQIMDEHLPEETPDAPALRELTFDDTPAAPASAPAPAPAGPAAGL